MKRNRLNGLILAPLLLVAACGPGNIVIKTNPPANYPAPVPSGTMVAGIGTADLTGPPGYPMNGYAISGKIARGVWIRPHVTALYVRDAAGVPFVFVTCDLWAISDGLKQRVVQILGDDPSTNFLAESDILLAGTHNHNSLGVNVPDPAYTLSSIGFGLDGQAYEFTAHRIATAVKQAIRNAKPSRIATLHAKVAGVSQCRSVKAYLRNPPSERQEWAPGVKLAGMDEQPSAEELADMVRDTMNAIVVYDRSDAMTGVLASFPVHPTAAGDRTQVYNADIFGLAAMLARKSLPNSPTVAFFNGSEGDVAPTYINHDRADVVRIAKLLSTALVGMVTKKENSEELTGSITHRAKTIDVANRLVPYDALDENCYCNLTSANVPTDAKAVYGASMFGGASDGRTFLTGYGVGEKIFTDKWSETQGYKLSAPTFVFANIMGEVIKGPLQSLLIAVVNASADPNIPISIHGIGGTYFAGVPAEFSTMLGRRTRSAIARTLGVSEERVILVGLADAYESYVTTACEYDEQAYEGASDLFGISEGQVFVKDFEALAGEPPINMSSRTGRKKDYGIGPNVSYGPQHLGALQTWNAEEGLANLMVSESGKPLKPHYLRTRLDQGNTPDIVSDTLAIAFSFEDSVRIWDATYDSDYYPSITITDNSHNVIEMPETILTVDDYSKAVSTWTIRIPDISSFVGKTVSIEVSPPLPGTAGKSALFTVIPSSSR